MLWVTVYISHSQTNHQFAAKNKHKNDFYFYWGSTDRNCVMNGGVVFKSTSSSLSSCHGAFKCTYIVWYWCYVCAKGIYGCDDALTERWDIGVHTKNEINPEFQ